MRQKKASLNLSVEAIIIIILAITMLGLGLGFIRGMFGQVTTTFDELINTEPEPPTSSVSNPVTLSRESIALNSEDYLSLKIAFYNSGASGTATYDCPSDFGSLLTSYKDDICNSVPGCTWSDPDCLGTGSGCADLMSGSLKTGSTANWETARTLACAADTKCTFTDDGVGDDDQEDGDADTCTSIGGGGGASIDPPDITCGALTIDDEQKPPAKSIPLRSSATFAWVAKVSGEPKTYLCTATFTAQGKSKDFTIRIR